MVLLGGGEGEDEDEDEDCGEGDLLRCCCKVDVLVVCSCLAVGREEVGRKESGHTSGSAGSTSIFSG